MEIKLKLKNLNLNLEIKIKLSNQGSACITYIWIFSRRGEGGRGSGKVWKLQFPSMKTIVS